MTLAPPLPAAPSARHTLYPRFDATRIVGYMTDDAYFDFENASVEKHECYEGWVIAMPGSSPEHNLINGNVVGGLFVALQTAQTDCDVYTSDQKIYVSSRKYVYADATIVCGVAQFDEKDCLRNPSLIVEILSPSTEENDRNDKFRAYRGIPSLRHYVLIEQFRPAVTHYEKQESGLWAIAGDYRELSDTLSFAVDGANAVLPLSTIYRRVSFPEPEISASGA